MKTSEQKWAAGLFVAAAAMSMGSMQAPSGAAPALSDGAAGGSSVGNPQSFVESAAMLSFAEPSPERCSGTDDSGAMGCPG